ncbi:methyltransferase domain-containing protein [Sneathiella glossodoripedis]|uniref:methyltransferase domain-containing protein n=1 Tax=Sneathiella glossodoripedis TaxID=418853 RepID=UPI000471E61C|nr:methyltransferase domain-containing protein [Sneathiella glossodoripedis]
MSAKAGSVKDQAEEKLPMKERLKLWWEGYELQEKRKPVENEAADQTANDDGPPTVQGWSVSRQRSVVTLFGDGMTRCIPDSAKKKLTNPLGINKTMSVVELGSGLGGFATWVVDQFETYVDAYEEEDELVEASTNLVKMAGLTRFIKVKSANFENFEPKLKSANVAYASEALFCVKNKLDCFRRIHGMMKPEGQFMMSDYMLEGKTMDDPDVQKWAVNEPRQPHLLDVQEIRKLLTKAGFEVSIAEDTTAEYKANVLKAFAEYAARTSSGEKSGHLHDWVLKEGELWTSRVQAMESGALKVFRIYARVPAEIL